MSLKFPGTKFSPCRVRCLDRPNTGVMGCNPALDADAYPVVLSGGGGVVRRVRKLRKTAISFVMYVRLSVRPHGTTLLPPGVFHGILYFGICPKSIEAVQVSLKSGESNCNLHEDQYTCPNFIEAVQVSLKSVKNNCTLHEDQYTCQKSMEAVQVSLKSGKNNCTLHEDQYTCTKSIEAVQVSLKSGKNNCTLHEDQYTFMFLSR